MARRRRVPEEPATETLSVKLTKSEMKALDSWQEAGLTRTTAVVKALTLLGTPSSKPLVPAVIETLPATRPRVPPQPFIQTPKVTKRTPASQCLASRGTMRVSGVIVCKECGKPYADHLR